MDEKNSEKIATPLPPALLKAIEDYRFNNRVPSRARAVRLLIEAGLRAEGKRAAPMSE